MDRYPYEVTDVLDKENNICAKVISNKYNAG